jgi:osmoprotectant transport system permease protein
MNTLRFFAQHAQEILQLTGQHLLLVAASTLAAALIGVPLGVVSAHRPRLARWVLGFAGVVQTIPSLALFGLLIPLPFLGGIGSRTAMLALVLYALLPIVRNTATGIAGVDPAVREAALGLGLTARQMLWMVELPLARGIIFAGLRVATVVNVGVATIAAAVGAGGLGMYIFRGVSMVDNRLILAGAIPAALLALLLDFLLGRIEAVMKRERSSVLLPVAVLCVLCVFVVISVLPHSSPATIVVGGKNFTEQLILGEILAQQIESRTALHVDRRLNLAGSLIAHDALLAGDIDMYVEYVGTALQGVLKLPLIADPTAAAARVRTEYAARWHIEAGQSLGFENTFAILVRGEDARHLHLRTISDSVPYAPQWSAGFGYEFMEREDGYAGLSRAYGLRFARPPKVLDLTLTYRALAGKQVDLIAGNSTDGLIPALDLVQLEDDRRYFPPYQAVTLVRGSTFAAHPELRAVLDALAGSITAEAMRKMNAEVDLDHRDPKEVAAQFLVGQASLPAALRHKE